MASFVPNFMKKVMISVGVGSGGMFDNFPFDMGDKICSSGVTDGLWTIHSGRSIAKGDQASRNITLFIADVASRPDAASAIRNGIRRLKTLKHPNILQYLDSIEIGGQIIMATESVTPISINLDEMSKYPDYLTWATFTLIKAIRFLNHEAKIIHGNVRPAALFVTPAGELKLGGFELSASITLDSEAVFCNYSRILQGVNYRDWPMEVCSPSASMNWNQIKALPSWTIDAFMLWVTLQNIYGNSKTPPVIDTLINSLHSSDPHKRPDPSNILTSPIFKSSKLISCNENIEHIAVMDNEMRERILADLYQQVDQFPNKFRKFKIVPCLVSLYNAFPISQKSAQGIRLLIRCASDMNPLELKEMFLPTFSLLLSASDRGCRLALLESLPSVIENVEPKFVQEVIYPQIISGFTDTLPILREQTLKTSLLLSLKLSPRQVNGELLRFYSRLQTDDQPGIRVNTIICIGRIASLLAESTRMKILGPAYTRALRDPFPPVRSSALLAIDSTIDFIPVTEMANILLPTIAPLLIDPEVGIRTAACKTIRHLIEVVEKFSASMPETGTVEKSPKSSSSHTKEVSTSSWRLSGLAEKLMSSTLGAEISPTMDEGSKPVQKQIVDSNANGWGEEVSFDLNINDNVSSVIVDQTPSWQSTDANPWSDNSSLSVNYPTTTYTNNSNRTAAQQNTIKPTGGTSRPMVLTKKKGTGSLFEDL